MCSLGSMHVLVLSLPLNPARSDAAPAILVHLECVPAPPECAVQAEATPSKKVRKVCEYIRGATSEELKELEVACLVLALVLVLVLVLFLAVLVGSNTPGLLLRPPVLGSSAPLSLISFLCSSWAAVGPCPCSCSRAAVRPGVGLLCALVVWMVYLFFFCCLLPLFCCLLYLLMLRP